MAKQGLDKVKTIPIKRLYVILVRKDTWDNLLSCNNKLLTPWFWSIELRDKQINLDYLSIKYLKLHNVLLLVLCTKRVLPCLRTIVLPSTFIIFAIGMSVFLKRTSFSGVSLNNLTRCDDSWKLALREAIEIGIQQGDVRPLQKSIFSLKEQTEAVL